jgi:hypothetical protein
MDTSFAKLKLLFRNVFIINTLFPPLHETLYAGRMQLFVGASYLFTLSVSRHLQNGVLVVHPSGWQNRWKLEGTKSGL